jgi:hypothetical protein
MDMQKALWALIAKDIGPVCANVQFFGELIIIGQLTKQAVSQVPPFILAENKQSHKMLCQY